MAEKIILKFLVRLHFSSLLSPPSMAKKILGVLAVLYSNKNLDDLITLRCNFINRQTIEARFSYYFSVWSINKEVKISPHQIGPDALNMIKFTILHMIYECFHFHFTIRYISHFMDCSFVALSRVCVFFSLHFFFDSPELWHLIAVSWSHLYLP